MKKINKKTLALLIAAALLLTITVSGTVAYLVDSTGAVKNVFEPGKVPPLIQEDFTQGAILKQNVTIKNDGNVDSYIRAMIIVTWQDTNGNVYPKLPDEGTDYTTDYGTGWTQEGNYWYYGARVPAKERTSNLIDKIEPVNGKEPADGYTLHVEILAQAVQADGIGVNSATAAFEAVEKAPTTK